MINYIIFYTIVLGLIGFKLWWDLRARKRGRIINHPLSAGIDLGLYIVSSFFLIGFWEFGCHVLIALMLRWILFDLLYNKFTNKNLYYCGENSKLDQWGDLVDGKDDQLCKVMFFLKIFGLILTLALLWTTHLF